MDRILKALIRRGILNNILVNNLLLLIGADRKFRDLIHPYANFQASLSGDTLQEIAGYSQHPEMKEVFGHLHDRLGEVREKEFPEGGAVLDVGCGPGLFLKDFDERFEKWGIDISSAMTELARKENPEAILCTGEFLDPRIATSWTGKFDLVYSVGVLEYFCRSELKPFIERSAEILAPNGILFISYPHALSLKDLWYPDLTYVQFSPAQVEEHVRKELDIMVHEQAYDGRKVGKYDTSPYPSGIPNSKRTYKNSYLLIARKKAL